MQLFHFGDDSTIATFVPRQLRAAADRGPDREWLNGPSIWASGAGYGHLYLFPREYLRIVIWPTERTSDADRHTWFRNTPCRAIAYGEDAWVDRVRTSTINRLC